MPYDKTPGDIQGAVHRDLHQEHLHAKEYHVVGDSGEPAFEGTWVNYDLGHTLLRFWRQGQMVYIEGAVKSGTSGTTVFTLPEDYWPDTHKLMAQYSTVGAQAYATVNSTTGTVTCVTSGATSFVSFSMWFRID